MSFVSHLQCIRCSTVYPADTVMNLCPLDDSPVEIINEALLFALDQNFPANDLIKLRDLSLVMSTWNPDLEGGER